MKTPDKCTLRLNTRYCGLTDFLLCNHYTLNARFEIGSDYHLNGKDSHAYCRNGFHLSHCKEFCPLASSAKIHNYVSCAPYIHSEIEKKGGGGDEDNLFRITQQVFENCGTVPRTSSGQSKEAKYCFL